MILWIKTAHLLFVIAWMAGVFYTPRILVHYIEGKEEGEDIKRLVIMADRLSNFTIIMSSLALITGGTLWLIYGIAGGWLYAKLVFVGLLVCYQVQTFLYVKEMKANNLIKTSIYLRIYNEAALICLIPILILVELKPF
tara:strand:- start:49 stop:465 length:417 start_codon:yes stop_codon:yes gene_type:complete